LSFQPHASHNAYAVFCGFQSSAQGTAVIAKDTVECSIVGITGQLDCPGGNNANMHVTLGNTLNGSFTALDAVFLSTAIVTLSIWVRRGEGLFSAHHRQCNLQPV
jgi:hypothetical protein